MGWLAGTPGCGANLDGCSDWGQPVTPRGKPVEINALWYSALCWARDWAERVPRGLVGVRLNNQAQSYAQQAQQVKHRCKSFGIHWLLIRHD